MELVKFMITCDKGSSDSLKQELAKIGVTEPRTSDVRGLGGEVVEFIIAGTVVAKGVAALLDVIASAIKLGKTVHIVKIEDREITNPSAGAVEQLKREIATTAK
jgi:hypothetical protein